MLRLAAQRGNIAVVEYILEHLDLNINIKDETGRTPLHYAIESSRAAATIQLLVSKGADISAQDYEGWSALHLATDLDKDAAIRALKGAGPSSGLPTEDHCGQKPIQQAKKNEAQNVIPVLSQAIALRLRGWLMSSLNPSFGKAAPKMEYVLDDPSEDIEKKKKKKLSLLMLRGYLDELQQHQQIVLAGIEPFRRALRISLCAVVLYGIGLIIYGK